MADESPQPFFRRMWTGLPVMFPVVALFHIALLLYNVWGFAKEDVLDTFIGAGTCIELLLYAFLWIAVCDKWRWAAVGYILLTAVNLITQFATAKGSEWRLVSDALFPFDVLMCFFLLFFYKRFR